MHIVSLFKQGSALLLLSFASLVVIGSAAPTAVSAQEETKKNLCSGANLKLGEGADESAEEGFNRSCSNPSDGSGNAQSNLESVIASIINILSVIVGIVAVVMIIIGGFKYITSGGDSGNVTSAKNTIIYAIVGLIVVALAQFLVRFVLNKVTDSTAEPTTYLDLASLL